MVVVYQGEWIAIARDMERDIIPMCRDEKVGIAPFGALGGGKLKSEDQIRAMEKSGEKGRGLEMMGSKINKEMSASLEKMIKKFGVGPTGIVLANVMHKAPYVFPIIGGRKVDHFQGNIEAFSKVHLSKQDIFPHAFLGGQHHASANAFLLPPQNMNGLASEFYRCGQFVEGVRQEGLIGKGEQQEGLIYHKVSQ